MNLQRSPLFSQPVLPCGQRRATRALQDTRQSICIWQEFMRYVVSEADKPVPFVVGMNDL